MLDIVRTVTRELYPHRSETAVTLDSGLDRDLGLDSLARSELLLRISEATRIELPETLLGTAERPRDLLAGLRTSPSQRRSERSVTLAASSTKEIPACFATGEAAGTAAAMAVRSGVSPRAVDVGELQRQLLKQGASLGI